jgi:hypothetical protein
MGCLDRADEKEPIPARFLPPYLPHSPNLVRMLNRIHAVD